ncbi:MAG: hypothetical protein N4A49_07290 [Marinifilaceae bacterium]|jgi:tetrahydromethanopterin S-methyltransferase subunit E|nr:hypothetical protein [Marinifilaceae bacterium]
MNILLSIGIYLSGLAFGYICAVDFYFPLVEQNNFKIQSFIIILSCLAINIVLTIIKGRRIKLTNAEIKKSLVPFWGFRYLKKIYFSK